MKARLSCENSTVMSWCSPVGRRSQSHRLLTFAVSGFLAVCCVPVASAYKSAHTEITSRALALLNDADAAAWQCLADCTVDREECSRRRQPPACAARRSVPA